MDIRDRTEVRLSESITVTSLSIPKADAVFLSTGSQGAPGELSSYVLDQFGLSKEHFPTPQQLASGYFISQIGATHFCFIVTVDGRQPSELLATNLGRCLQDYRLQSMGSWWIPLMGTGVAGLQLTESFTVIFNALIRSGFDRRPGIAITISTPGPDTRGFEPLWDSIEGIVESAEENSRRSSTAPANEARSPAEVVIAVADALAQSRQDPYLTTEVLLFGIVDAAFSDALAKFQGDPDTSAFSSAIRELAAELYDSAWQQLFGRDRDTPSMFTSVRELDRTRNVATIFRRAEARATSAGRGKQYSVDDLVRALLESEGEYVGYLSMMGVEPAELLEAYEDVRTGQVVMNLLNDTASSEDHLGYTAYADAISSFLKSPGTSAPLSISIQAPWGVGKSSLMKMIRDRIDRQKASPELRDKTTERQLTLGQVMRFLDRKKDVDTPVLLDPANLAVAEAAADGSSRPTPASWRWRNRIRAVFAPVIEFYHQTSQAKAAAKQDLPARNAFAAGDAIPSASRDSMLTIWFNAWKYESSEQVWAGLVDAIVSQISDRLPVREREAFLLRLHLSRIDDGIVRRKIYDRIATVWLAQARRAALLGASAMLSFLGLGAARAAFPELGPITSRLSQYGYPGAIASLILLALYLVGRYWITQRQTQAEPARFSLAPYLTVPDYTQSVGAIHQIHADLKRVLTAAPKESSGEHSPIVIFVDDLDRCSPAKIANVVEGVSMLLASDTYRCMFVIGMDPQMIAAALDKAHEDIRQRLPSYERGVPLGWRFMDKFVQLPFTIPPQAKLDNYLKSLGASARHASASITKPSASVDPDVTPPAAFISAASDGVGSVMPSVSPSAAVKASTPAADSRDVGHIIRELGRHSAGNPREIKRMVNLARLYLSLRNARRRIDPQWRAPSLDHYARWITLTLRWPDMMRWLQWGADEAPRQVAEDAAANLVVRRLETLEQATRGATCVIDWASQIEQALHLSQGDAVEWRKDSKLFEFFQYCAQPASGKRLSDSARSGFW